MEQKISKLMELEANGKKFIYSGNTGILLEIGGDTKITKQLIEGMDDEAKKCLLGEDGNSKNLKVSSTKDTSLQNITVFTSNACNLDCGYCYVTKNNAVNENKMSIETFKTAMNNLFDTFDTSRRINILFFGGEPLLNVPFLEEAIQYLKSVESEGRTKFSYSLTTNGTVLSDKIIDIILQNNMSVVVSIDGEKEVHDNMRPFKATGLGSYDKILKNVKILSEYKKIKARVTLCDVDVSFVDIYEELREAGFWDVHLVVVADEEKDESLLADKLSVLKRRISEMEEYILRNLQEGRLVRFGDYLKYLKKIHLGFTPENKPMRFPCTAGHSSYCLATSGDYFLCHRFNNVEEYKFGSANSGIDEEHRRKFLEEHNIVTRIGKCDSCWAASLCGGTCYHPSYTHSGETRPVNELHCKYTLEMIQSALRVYLGMSPERRYLLENIH
jgi:uncharacterized protein